MELLLQSNLTDKPSITITCALNKFPADNAAKLIRNAFPNHGRVLGTSIDRYSVTVNVEGNIIVVLFEFRTSGPSGTNATNIFEAEAQRLKSQITDILKLIEEHGSVHNLRP